MNQLFFYWVMAALVGIILEIGHPGLFLFFSVSIGALAAALVAYFEFSFASQCAVALISSIVFFLLMSHWVTRTFAPDQVRHKTNVDAMIGKKGVVTMAIGQRQSGQVSVAGQTWTARSIHGDHIAQDEQVVVVEVRGAHLLVERVAS